MVDENGHTLGYYQQRYYIFRCFAERRARLLAKHYRYRKFYVEATR
jgi:hypothetical protein